MNLQSLHIVISSIFISKTQSTQQRKCPHSLLGLIFKELRLRSLPLCRPASVTRDAHSTSFTWTVNIISKKISKNFVHGYDTLNPTYGEALLNTGKKPKLPDLEASLSEITTLIEQMEQGELSLEQSLTSFERGITLIKHAQKLLQDAEQKVQILMQNNGNETLEDYENKE
jgi:exodeoxyribonuclease VII small subunit